jgi:hypothetical protein
MSISNHQQGPSSIQKPKNLKSIRLRAARPLLREAGSAVLECAAFLAGNDLITATRLIDSADLLLRRFRKLERRSG